MAKEQPPPTSPTDNLPATPTRASRVMFSGDPPDLDEALRELAGPQVAAGLPIKLRIQPDIYVPQLPGGGRVVGLEDRQPGAFYSWRGVTWVVEVDTLDEARAFKDALTAFVKAVGTFGALGVQRALGGLR